MALPKFNDNPVYELTLPSSKKVVKFRPFLVKEEKILLTGMASEDIKDQVNALLQVIQNCCLDDLDVDRLTILDIEYFFIKLRARSVGEIVTLRFQCKRSLEDGSECGETNLVKIDLDEIEPEEVELDPVIILSEKEGIGVKMRHPKFDLFYKIRLNKNDPIGVTFDLIAQCIESVFDAEKTYSDFGPDEIQEFLENLNRDQMAKITDFLNALPSLKKDVEIVCNGKCENTEPIIYTVEGFENFLA